MKTHTVLGLDTSTLSISTAIVRASEDGSWELLCSRERGPEGPNHSTLLPLWIDELLAEAGLHLRELDGIAVGIGPGGFTGLRIALATAKGLAYAARLPLVGVSTLEAMALRARRICEPEASKRSGASSSEARAEGVGPALAVAGSVATPSRAGAIVPILDARKQEVYAGFYREAGPGVAALGEEVVERPEAVAERLAALQGPLVLLGEGYFAYRSLFDEATAGRRLEWNPALPPTPPAAEIAGLGATRLQPYSKEAIFALEPRYIRPSDAEFSPAPGKNERSLG